MDIEVTFRHTKPSEAIKQHITEKMQRVLKYLIKPNACHVILSVEKFRHAAEITLSEEGGVYSAKDDCTDMYSSIDKAIHKLEHQLKKHKEKVKTHKGKNSPNRELLFNS